MNCAYERGQPPPNANNLPVSVDTMWIAKKLEINNRRTLRSFRGGSRNTLLLETGIIRGQPRDAGGVGKPAPRTDVWPRRRPAVPGSQVTGRRGTVRPGEVPSISYMEGTFVSCGCSFEGWCRLLAGWLAASGARHRRIPRGLVPITVLSHFALAVTGLGVWITFMVAGSPVLAWLAVGLIVLTAGLGMGALSTALSQPSWDAAPTRAGTPVAVIAVHGVLATATILLVLLAAIGAA